MSRISTRTAPGPGSTAGMPRSDGSGGTSRSAVARTSVARSATRPSASRPSSSPLRLRHLDEALQTLERAEAMLAEARAVRATDPRAAFELTHRAALRTAGVVIERANRERTRRLPLNAWTALGRCGTVHRRWAEEAAPFVAERTRLAARADAMPDPVLLEEHMSSTATQISAVRAETLVALLPEAATAAERG